jgi:hypothetical protein
VRCVPKLELSAVAFSMCDSRGASRDRGVAYYDITNPRAPVLLGTYRADEDRPFADSIPPCGAPPRNSTERCAASQHAVTLVKRTDGRILSLSVEPGASASRYPSGDLRIVDVTNPRVPRQVGSFPPPGQPIFSNNGCRPFSAAHGAGATRAGDRAYLAFYDGGVFVLDMRDPSRPVQEGRFTYPDQRELEGSAAYVVHARIGKSDLALVSEADFIGPRTSLIIHSPSHMAGSSMACEAMFTMFAPSDTVALFRKQGNGLTGTLAYAGRGCPSSHGMGMMHDNVATRTPDDYLSDVRGRIVLLDRARQPLQATIRDGPGCTVAERARRAQDEGAEAVVILQTSATAPQAFSPDGDPAGLGIPVVMIDKGIADSLRATLCPHLEKGRCSGGESVVASIRDEQGEWGSFRVLDVTLPSAVSELALLRVAESAKFPPASLRVSSPQRAAVSGSVAAVPWNSDGVRIIDLASAKPREVASYVPPDRPDPSGVLPARAYVMSVAALERGRRTFLLVTDINSGLYVLELSR